ncbi:MBL fold metallo-hydrolase [Haloplanus aerogenes]|uniref:Glyoxylase-like metal-dependent hydrolase (Beta-lactamase superfamily II) n=1 Tax=Haloplanus aerogenes TaxID=660522 RepID=A0A3M0DES8_9EURY|nr:MBL fold metallo-hydrolase [Haloplanus aerogenes]AZH24942.1 MBL fold metallo-hydrolase [Haloplanus aerogenes]RMB13843.1 glyoxylase-like metal-dependent hydrolase (beta-lactamase superfamily II) [Haloplanus aerogenes]
MTVKRIPVPTETTAGGETNAYLAGTVLIDPAARTDTLDAAVAERRVDHIAITHAHPDHVAAVAHYAAETGATVHARRGREARFEAATGVVPDRTFVEGERVGDLTVLDTPGHAPDHVAFETAGGIVSGDLARASGSVAVAAPEGDMRAYLVALRRLLARDPPRLFPGHGPTIDDPRATLRRLYDHRLDRERRIERAVRAGADSVDAVLDAAYDQDLTGVRDLAAATVRAHLDKLAAEGRVRFDRETGQVGVA